MFETACVAGRARKATDEVSGRCGHPRPVHRGGAAALRRARILRHQHRLDRRGAWPHQTGLASPLRHEGEALWRCAGRDLGAGERELQAANEESIAFIASLRDEFQSNAEPVVLNAVVGPRGDAYAPDATVAAQEAETYHAKQLSWLAGTEVDMVSALTFTQADEATGFVRAAHGVGLPAVVSFTVETDGHLPTGQPLKDVIRDVDEATDGAAAYFMVNCAHPDHFFHVFDDADWTRRVRGLRCNASRKSHDELDESETLDDGNPEELAVQYAALLERMPWINVLGACCGSDLRHVAEIARAARS